MEKIKNKIVLTGATGFIGRHLLEDIDAVPFKLTAITRGNKKINNLPANASVIQADLNEYHSLKKAFEGIDVVINTAAEVRNADKLTETNIQGTKNLIRAAVENKVSKIIHLSSVGVAGAQYNNSCLNVDESYKCSPKNEYERTKLESEKLLLHAAEQNCFSLVILRPSNVFGEDHPFNALLNLISHVNSGKLVLHSPDAVVNYVYVKDITKLMIRLINDEQNRGVLNAGYSLKLDVFIDLLAAELGKKANKKKIPQFLINFIELLRIKKLRSVSNAVVYDDSKLKSFYDYPYGIKKGIERTINYYKEQNLVK